MMDWANVFLTLTHLAAIPVFLQFPKVDSITRRVVLVAILASILQHLSDTKHGQKGIWPWNLNASMWLKIDRTTATFTVIYYLWKFWTVLDLQTVLLGCLGIVFLRLSELLGQYGYKPEFVIVHTWWHCIAFYCMYWCMNRQA